MGFLANLANSRYLKKEDAMPTPILLTIAEIKEENVAMDNEPPKMKQVAYFKETDKGFVIGKVTGSQMASFLGDPGDTPVAWYGKQIVLYCDPNVMMKGKLVGGLRVRAPRGAAAVASQQTTFRQPVQTGAPKPPPQEEEDNVPY